MFAIEFKNSKLKVFIIEQEYNMNLIPMPCVTYSPFFEDSQVPWEGRDTLPLWLLVSQLLESGISLSIEDKIPIRVKTNINYNGVIITMVQ